MDCSSLIDREHSERVRNFKPAGTELPLSNQFREPPDYSSLHVPQDCIFDPLLPRSRTSHSRLACSVSHCAQLSHPPYPPTASQSISLDVPVAQARAFRFFPLCPKGNSQTVLHCTHRGNTFLSGGLGEQEGWSGCSPPTPSLTRKRSGDYSQN